MRIIDLITSVDASSVRPVKFQHNQYGNPLSANPTEWSNTLKQFVGYCRRILLVYLTILWCSRLKV